MNKGFYLSRYPFQTQWEIIAYDIWRAAWEAASKQLIVKEINKLERRFKAKGKKDAAK